MSPQRHHRSNWTAFLRLEGVLWWTLSHVTPKTSSIELNCLSDFCIPCSFNLISRRSSSNVKWHISRQRMRWGLWRLMDRYPYRYNDELCIVLLCLSRLSGSKYEISNLIRWTMRPTSIKASCLHQYVRTKPLTFPSRLALTKITMFDRKREERGGGCHLVTDFHSRLQHSSPTKLRQPALQSLPLVSTKWGQSY